MNLYPQNFLYPILDFSYFLGWLPNWASNYQWQYGWKIWYLTYIIEVGNFVTSQLWSEDLNVRLKMANKAKNNHQKQIFILTLNLSKRAQTQEVNAQKGQFFFYQQKFMCLGLWRQHGHLWVLGKP